jgi:hypothetical protein
MKFIKWLQNPSPITVMLIESLMLLAFISPIWYFSKIQGQPNSYYKGELQATSVLYPLSVNPKS